MNLGQRTEVPDMFRRKNDKRIVELNPEELRLAKYALLGFRNKLVAQGKPTEDINALLLKIMKQPMIAARNQNLAAIIN